MLYGNVRVARAIVRVLMTRSLTDMREVRPEQRLSVANARIQRCWPLQQQLCAVVENTLRFPLRSNFALGNIVMVRRIFCTFVDLLPS